MLPWLRASVYLCRRVQFTNFGVSNRLKGDKLKYRSYFSSDDESVVVGASVWNLISKHLLGPLSFYSLFVSNLFDFANNLYQKGNKHFTAGTGGRNIP